MTLQNQGRLMDITGVPINGNQDVTLSLYDDEVATMPLWSEDSVVAFDNGYYALTLGDDSSNPLDNSHFLDGSLFLELAVGGITLTERLAIASVPYAISAGTTTNLSGGVVDATEIRVNGN
ncbi:MAG: hypothetical protein HN348_32405, partial [Proteobacteria bacterium]|nr:hypothetical protein [Pseudomonadota bacterium]